MNNGLAYRLLEQMCKVKSTRSSKKGYPFTERVNFIMDALMDLGIPFEHDRFDSFVNITVKIKGQKSTSSVVYLAHHDIVNPDSDNCNDNTASVCNLLALADHYTNNQPVKDVYIVFTDGEEIGGYGSQRLSDQINRGDLGYVEYAVNLELTAFGKNLLVDGKNFEGESKLLDLTMATFSDAHIVSTPFNDSIILRREGIDSLCLCPVDDNGYGRALEGKVPKSWMVCHSDRDGFEQAIEGDMDNFVGMLTQLVGDPMKLSPMERIKRFGLSILKRFSNS